MTRIDPGMPKAVIQRTAEIVYMEDGPREATKITMPPEYFEQYRQGYRCPACHAVQSVPFPEVCETVWKDTGDRCGFKIKTELERWLNQEFRGEDPLWPGRDKQDEFYAMEDERDDWIPRSGIWLPGKE